MEIWNRLAPFMMFIIIRLLCLLLVLLGKAISFMEKTLSKKNCGKLLVKQFKQIVRDHLLDKKGEVLVVRPEDIRLNRYSGIRN